VDAHEALEILDENPAAPNDVVLIYSLRSESKSNWPSWNREHLWPNSYGIDSVQPSYSDLHNLRACDASVNSSRGNKYFEESDPSDPNYRAVAHPEASDCSTDSDSWEPPDEEKGDIARAAFYMMVRYNGDTIGEPDLTLTDHVGEIDSSTNFMGRLSTFVRWHVEDPVSPEEVLRNDLVYALYQGNRNPFVDRPDWAAAAFIPRLTISVLSDAVNLSWSADAPSMQLEMCGVLNTNWVSVTNSPELVSAEWLVSLPSIGTGRFFRLRFD
jgi:endonuclease I